MLDYGIEHLVWNYWVVWWDPNITGEPRQYRIIQR